MSIRESRQTTAPLKSPEAASDRDVLLLVVEVSKSFQGVNALSGVNFSIRPGQIKALIGPNGAGKTTLLNIVNGLLSPNSGQILFQGRDLMGMKPEDIALQGVSRTFQMIRLVTVNQVTVLDNVLLGAHKRLHPTLSNVFFFRGQADRLEKEVQEQAREALRFVGLEWAADKEPGALSFGNQRLVELARALLAEPVLLLLDEPASGLNEGEVEGFMELLLTLKARGMTILLVEHNMKLVMNVSDDIVVLDFGRRLAEGPPEEVCADPEVIKAYLGAEASDLTGGR